MNRVWRMLPCIAGHELGFLCTNCTRHRDAQAPLRNDNQNNVDDDDSNTQELLNIMYEYLAEILCCTRTEAGPSRGGPVDGVYR